MATANTKIREFGSSKKVSQDPIKFTFCGEEIEAYRSIPGTKYLKFVKMYSSDDTADNVEAIYFYLDISFDPENHAKFFAKADDPDYGVDIEVLQEVIKFITEERSENPSKES